MTRDRANVVPNERLGDGVPAARPKGRTVAATIMWLALLCGVACALQAYTSTPWDADTAYHMAVARLLRRYGVLHHFPWTRFSILADRYADKEFLFHLLLIPVSGLRWVTGAKIAGAALGSVVLWAIFGVLRAERVRWAGVWTVAVLASSGYFIMRLALVRPHLLSIALALGVTWAAAHRRWLPLAVLCLLYPVSYTAWHLAIGLPLLVEIAVVASGRPPVWKGVAIATGAVTLGVLLHPNFPNILTFFWIQNVQILVATAWAKKGGFALGSEFLPMPWRSALRYELLPWLFAVAAVTRAARSRRDDPVPLGYAFVALVFCALTAKSQRFVEYAAPFATIALATTLRGIARPRAVTATVAAVASAWWLLLGTETLRPLSARAEDVPDGLAKMWSERVPYGAKIFTCNWLTTGELMLALPDRRFLVALDPVLFYARDPGLYAEWYTLVRSAPPNPAEIVATDFDSDFVICERPLPEFKEFREALDRDPRATLLMQSELWSLYAIAR
jgi:hypothetical protein